MNAWDDWQFAIFILLLAAGIGTVASLASGPITP